MLLTMPKDLGEFVIVHELVHLLTPTYGKLFKLFMHAYLPDWEERERRLQVYARAKGSQGRFKE
jgi:predicted metal-dependent hydrolase